jgi:hypothetical protein
MINQSPTVDARAGRIAGNPLSPGSPRYSQFGTLISIDAGHIFVTTTGVLRLQAQKIQRSQFAGRPT